MAGEEAEAAASAPTGKFETLNVNVENGIYKITLNRPSKKNAINFKVILNWIMVSD